MCIMKKLNMDSENFYTIIHLSSHILIPLSKNFLMCSRVISPEVIVHALHMVWYKLNSHRAHEQVMTKARGMARREFEQPRNLMPIPDTSETWSEHCEYSQTTDMNQNYYVWGQHCGTAG